MNLYEIIASISTLLLSVITFSVQPSQTCRVYFKEADKFLQYIATRDDLKTEHA